MNKLNKLAHGIVLTFFGMACVLVWALLKMLLLVSARIEPQLPAFTRLCMAVGTTVVLSLAMLATGYCVWVWFNKGDGRKSWVGFLATTTGSLFFVTLPIVVSIFLALVNVIDWIPVK